MSKYSFMLKSGLNRVRLNRIWNREGNPRKHTNWQNDNPIDELIADRG